MRRRQSWQPRGRVWAASSVSEGSTVASDPVVSALGTTYRGSEPVATAATAAWRSRRVPRVASGCEPGRAGMAASSAARNRQRNKHPGRCAVSAETGAIVRSGADGFDAAGIVVGGADETRIDAIEGEPHRRARLERHGIALKPLLR